jgi:hypothetical protein
MQLFRLQFTLGHVPQHTKGDKIRIKRGRFAGERGILVHAHSGKWAVSLIQHDCIVLVPDADLTNYSLAARRAWRSMPDRKVGRPAGSKVSDRISVIFRIDRVLWNEFLDAEQSGLVGDRTNVINESLRNVLASAQRLRPKAS